MLIPHDDHGRIVLVKPNYRHDTWEIPVGRCRPWPPPARSHRHAAICEIRL
jgi:hypothetical protein